MALPGRTASRWDSIRSLTPAHGVKAHGVGACEQIRSLPRGRARALRRDLPVLPTTALPGRTASQMDLIHSWMRQAHWALLDHTAIQTDSLHNSTMAHLTKAEQDRTAKRSMCHNQSRKSPMIVTASRDRSWSANSIRRPKSPAPAGLEVGCRLRSLAAAFRAPRYSALPDRSATGRTTSDQYREAGQGVSSTRAAPGTCFIIDLWDTISYVSSILR